MLQKAIYMIAHPDRWLRWIKDLYLDMRYGSRFLGKPIINEDLTRGWYNSTNTDYDALAILFSVVKLRPNDVVVDVGCGKGRVFNWLLKLGLKNKLIGVEARPEIAEFARERLRQYPQVEIVTEDITQNIPAAGTVFYLFNPFSAELIQQFSDLLAEKMKQGHYTDANRPLLIYYNCCHLHIFEQNPLWKIEKMGVITCMGLPAALIEPRLID